MKVLSLLLLLSASAAAQSSGPGPIVFTIASKQNCGLRVWSTNPNVIQAYCLTGDKLQTVSVNLAMPLPNPTAAGGWGGSFMLSAAVAEPDGSITSIGWFVWTSLNYQIATYNCKPPGLTAPPATGTVGTTGACTFSPMQSGVLVPPM